MPMPVPRKVEPDAAARVLRVVWNDGHRSEIPYALLRDRCPCANCRAARERNARVTLPMALTTKLLGWRRVGNYALHFSWGDSHSEGIFAYDYLRDLCPCADCAAAPPAGDDA